MTPEEQRSAELVYAQMRHLYEASLRIQVEYGRWLISSLLLLHSAAIAGFLFKATGNTAPPYMAALWWFVFGVVLALGAGFAAWGNFSAASRMYDKAADHRMLSDVQYWPAFDANERTKISLTYWASIIAGVLSALCILGGAAAVWCSWR